MKTTNDLISIGRLGVLTQEPPVDAVLQPEAQTPEPMGAAVHGQGAPAAEVQDHQVSPLRPVRPEFCSMQYGAEIVQQDGRLAHAEYAQFRQPMPFEAGTIAGCENPLVGDRLEGCSYAKAAGTGWQIQLPHGGMGNEARGK